MFASPWTRDLRNILSLEKTEGKRKDEVSSLVKSIEKMVKDASKYPALSDQQELAAFTQTCQSLRSRYEQLEKQRKTAEDAGPELRKLKQEARILIGQVNPRENPKVERAVLKVYQQKPIYEARQKEISDAIATLKSVPGTKAQQDQLRHMLDAAAGCLPDYVKAAGKLYHDSGLGWFDNLPDITAVAERDAADLPRRLFDKIDKTFATTFAGAEGKLKEYSDLARYADSEGVNELEKELGKILKDAEDGAEKDAKTANQTAKAAIAKLVTTLDGRIATTKQAKLAVEKPKSDVAGQWAEVQKTAPRARQAVWTADREQAESLEANQMYELAKDAYETLDAIIAAVLTYTSAASTEWQSLQTEITAMEATLKQAEPLPELRAAAATLRATIDKAREEAGPEQDFATACQLIKASRNEAQELKQASDPSNQGADFRFQDANRTVEVKLAKLGFAVRKLTDEAYKKIVAITQAGGDDTQLKADLQVILSDLEALEKKQKKDFDANFSAAPDANAKSKVLDTFLQDIDQEFSDPRLFAQALVQKAEATMSNKNALKEGQNKKGALDAIRGVERAMADLEVMHLPGDTESTDLLTRIRADLPDLTTRANQNQPVKALVDFHVESIAKRKKAVEAEIAKRQEEADSASKKLNARIAEMELSSPQFTKYFDSLRLEVALAVGARKSKIAKVSDGAKKTLEDLEKKLKSLDADYSGVEKKRINIQFSVSAIEQQDKGTYLRLKADWKKLQTKIAEKRPAEAKTSLEEFEKGALATAEEFVKDLKAFFKEATAVRKSMESSGLKDSCPELCRALETQRQAAKQEASSSAASLYFAKGQLKAIKLQIDTSKKDKPFAQKANAEAAEEQFADKRRKAEYQAEKEVLTNRYFMGTLDDLRETQKFLPQDTPSAFTPDDLETIGNLINLADKMADREPPDFAGARKHLAAANEMARNIKDNAPDDLNTDSSPRGRTLKKLNETWKGRVSEYVKDVLALRDAIANATPPANQSIDKAAVQKAFKPVMALFNPKAFDADIEVLAKPKSKQPLDERRATKEKVLLRIRQFQAQAKNNALLKHIMANTNTISKVKLKPLQDVLEGLRKEVLGS